MAVLGAAPAGASLPVDVPIVNADFEADSIASPGGDLPTITGWDTTAGGGDGIFRPTTGEYPQGIPSGENVAYVNLPGTRVRQVLITPLEASTRYRLSVEVGWNDNDPFEGYLIQPRANGTILASQDSGVMPRQGEFVTAASSTSLPSLTTSSGIRSRSGSSLRGSRSTTTTCHHRLARRFAGRGR